MGKVVVIRIMSTVIVIKIIGRVVIRRIVNKNIAFTIYNDLADTSFFDSRYFPVLIHGDIYRVNFHNVFYLPCRFTVFVLALHRGRKYIWFIINDYINLKKL
jgi:hypothetical protein